MSIITFKPIVKERVWGGRDLKNKIGRELPDEGVFGESWEIVDRPEAQSIVASGEFEGLSVRELIRTSTKDIMGPDWEPSCPFPILVKWLDCQDRLSLQVHPPADIAPELKGEPKTECWYIADCSKDANLIAGLKNGTSEEAFEAALRDNTLEKLCHRFAVSQGDHIFIPSGRIHAIDAGNFILEIQQNSDTTYRVYDWNRTGLDGKPREIHIQESMKSIDFNDFEPAHQKAKAGEANIADCKEFRTRKIELSEQESISFPKDEDTVLIGIVSGNLKENRTNRILKSGDNVLKPYSSLTELIALEKTVLLITDRFIQS